MFKGVITYKDYKVIAKLKIEDEKLETLVRLVSLMTDIEIIEVHIYKESEVK